MSMRSKKHSPIENAIIEEIICNLEKTLKSMAYAVIKDTDGNSKERRFKMATIIEFTDYISHYKRNKQILDKYRDEQLK